jgi:DNA-binding transcriptional MerR regulator
MPKVVYNSKIHYSLKSVSQIAGLEAYVIRYWQVEGLITLNKNRAGNLFFTHEDVKKVLFIKKCLRDDRLTIAETKLLAETWRESEESQTEIEFK